MLADADQSVLKTLLDNGGTLFDTAPGYGASEEVAGRIVREAGPLGLTLADLTRWANEQFDPMLDWAKVRRIRDQGSTVVFVEHVMRAVMALTDRVVVFDRGEVLAEGPVAEVMQRPEVMTAYLGQPHAAALGAVGLDLHNQDHGVLRDHADQREDADHQVVRARSACGGFNGQHIGHFGLGWRAVDHRDGQTGSFKALACGCSQLGHALGGYDQHPACVEVRSQFWQLAQAASTGVHTPRVEQQVRVGTHFVSFVFRRLA